MTFIFLGNAVLLSDVVMPGNQTYTKDKYTLHDWNKFFV